MTPRPDIPPPPDDFQGAFQTILERRDAFASAAGPFSLRPGAVAVPAGRRDVAVLARWAARNGVPLVPRGGGTGMPGGNVGAGVVVHMTPGFDTVGPVNPAGRSIRVGPGALAASVERAASREGLFFPPLPSSADRCRIGGMVANNAAGARSFRHGSVRKWVRKLEVVMADGQLLRLESGEDVPAPFEELHRALRPRWSVLSGDWPRVRKNASGYALDRFLPEKDSIQLMVGSEGTLGLVTAIELGLAPAPEARGLAVLGVETPDCLRRGIRAAGELRASACEFLGRRFLELTRLESDPRVGALARGAYALMLLELEGRPGEVDDGLEHIRALARSMDAGVRTARDHDERARLWEIRHAASPAIVRAAEEGRISMQFVEDSVIPPEFVPEYLRGMDRILVDADTDAVVFGHAGDGNVHVNPLVDVRRTDWRDRVRGILDQTADLVAELGGTLSGEHGDGRVRAPYLHRIWSEAAVDGFRTVKETLDPARVLNPGVILPRPDQDPLEGLREKP